jgi:hypothetical protein
MKPITDKVIALISALKGKKANVVIAAIVLFVLGTVAVKYGYIPESMLNINVIIDQVSTVFGKDSATVVIDSLPK